MPKTPVASIAPEKVRKVRSFLEVEEKVQAFKAANYEIFQQFAQLLRERNDALEDAEKDVRARGVNCGPFTVCGEMRNIDVERLYTELGEEDFLRVGGVVSTRRVLEMDVDKFETATQLNAIPKEVAEACFSKTLKFKTPRRAEIP